MRSHAKGAKARADKYFSLIVRSRGRCERCGSTDYSRLQCAHIVSRRFSATRCDEINAAALCGACHLRLTNEPYEHVAFAIGRLGEAAYAELRARALAGGKQDWETVADELRDRWNQIKGTA